MAPATPARTARLRGLRSVQTKLTAAVATTLALTFLVAVTAPLYTDEIGFKTQVSRVFAEGGVMVSVLPQCAGSHVLPVPLSWYPGAVANALAFRPLGLLGLKLSGVALAFGWFGLAFFLLGRLGGAATRARRFGLLVAPGALGLVPFTLVMARAESLLVFCLLAFAGFAFGGFVGRRDGPRRVAAFLTLFAFLVSLFYFGHPKALFSTPAIALAGWLAFERRGRAWGAVALLVVLIVATQSFVHAGRAARCPESAWVEHFFGLLTLSPSLARTSPAAFFETGAEDVAKSAWAIAKDMALTPVFPAGWLPPLASESASLDPFTRGIATLTRGLIVALELAAVGLGLGGLVRVRRGSPRARRAALFAATLLVCLGGHLFFTKHWPFYNTGFAIPQLALVATLGAAALAPTSPVLRRVGARIAPLFLAASLLSSVVTLAHLGPRLLARASSDRVGTLLPDQPASVPPLHYAREREAIRAHAARCGIQGDGATKLVVDDATFFAFEDLHRPVHLVYVSDATMWGVDMPGEKNAAFLRRLGVSGMVTRCANLPTALAPKMHRDALGYCCLGAADPW